jgi:hypothetical protein
MNVCFIRDEMLGKLRQTRVGGIDLDKLRTRRASEVVLALAPSPASSTAAELAEQVSSMTRTKFAYGVRRGAYDIKKFRAKGIVRKIERSSRYDLAPEGLRALTALSDRSRSPLRESSGRHARAFHGTWYRSLNIRKIFPHLLL